VPRIAFVTSEQYPQLTADDRLAALELDRTGLSVEPVIWRNATVNWAGFDLVILRSMWDYHLHIEEFLHWLDRLEASGARVWNPIPLARWNTDKRYLRDLQTRGVEIVPTRWFERGTTPSLAEEIENTGWTEAVIKPMVSSTAFRTWRVKREDAGHHEAAFHELLAERPAMLQEYQPTIITEGEFSVMFIASELSHTVLKKPVPGDFRTQEEFGGTTAPAIPEPELLDLAWRAVEATESAWLYGRVDAVRSPYGFRVSELEMLEPGLFLMEDPDAPKRFAAAIRDQLLQTA
jgi:glutathione synthase/RimK-type ligase-like ATP-grasp enzyme